MLAINKDGEWGSVDVLDIDDESFRALIIDVIQSMDGPFHMLKVETPHLPYREKRE